MVSKILLSRLAKTRAEFHCRTHWWISAIVLSCFMFPLKELQDVVAATGIDRGPHFRFPLYYLQVCVVHGAAAVHEDACLFLYLRSVHCSLPLLPLRSLLFPCASSLIQTTPSTCFLSRTLLLPLRSVPCPLARAHFAKEACIHKRII